MNPGAIFRPGRRGWVVGVLVTALGLATAPTQTVGQEDDREEGRFLRRAAALESDGDRAGAERVLRTLLERHPASSGGIFALERVLRADERVAEILPLADRYLAREPRASGIRYLKLRVLAEIDSLAALQEAARRWTEAESGSPDPYREIARVYERSLGPERALEVLREARDALDSSEVLAVEIGDLLMRIGDETAAVLEWSRAVGEEGAEAARILRRLRQIEGDPAEVARPLVEALDRAPTTADRRRVGVRIAVETGLHEEAVRLAGRVLPELDAGARRGFLADVARRSEEEGAERVALWAWEALREETPDAGGRRALDVRIAAAAVAVGDTARALQARRRLARALPPGSPERRRVVADLIRLEASRADPDTLIRRIRGFRQEFPDAPELDELASVAAAGLDARGREEGAIAMLQGVSGPRSALQRAFLHLEDGDLEKGRAVLEEAVGGLPPARATEVIQLLSLLDRLGPGGVEVAVAMTVRDHRQRPREALAALDEGLEGVPEADRPALLALGARVADAAGLPTEAADLRGRLVERHPDAPEAAPAMLALARFRARDDGGLRDAVRLLEDLILERPSSPVVPDARRELQRLRERIPGGGPT